MKTTIVQRGIYWGNGKENGNYIISILGLYRDNG